MGVVRNPRMFHGILKVPFDLKRFWNARPGLTGWVILNISYLAALSNPQAVFCFETGDVWQPFCRFPRPSFA